MSLHQPSREHMPLPHPTHYPGTLPASIVEGARQAAAGMPGAKPGLATRADPRWGAAVGGPPPASVSPDRADDRLHGGHDIVHSEFTLVALLLRHFLRGAL